MGLMRSIKIVIGLAKPPEAPISAPKGRRVPVKALVLLILLTATVLLYWTSLPNLQFDGTDAVRLSNSKDPFYGTGSAEGTLFLVINGRGKFTMESMEVSIDGTSFTVGIYIAPAPHVPDRVFIPTAAIMPTTMNLPAYIVVDLRSRIPVSEGEPLKIHVVGDWIILPSFHQRVDLNAVTEVQWFRYK